MTATGYAPLSIVYRILGDHARAIAIADRGIEIIARAQSDPRDASQTKVEAARCIAARALAVVAGGDTMSGIQQMELAVRRQQQDPVVLALAKQLSDHIEKIET